MSDSFEYGMADWPEEFHGLRDYLNKATLVASMGGHFDSIPDEIDVEDLPEWHKVECVFITIKEMYNTFRAIRDDKNYDKLSAARQGKVPNGRMRAAVDKKAKATVKYDLENMTPEQIMEAAARVK